MLVRAFLAKKEVTMKYPRKIWALACLIVSVIVAALAINWRNKTHEVFVEISWRVGALLTFLFSWLESSAHEGMTYLNENAAGVGALCSIAGVCASIYFQGKNSNKSDKEGNE